MSHKSSEKFWLENPCVLITNFCKFSPFGPFTDKRFSNNMNAYTRLIIILSIVIYTITKEINYIFIGIFLIVLIIIMYYSLKKDSFKVLPSSFPFMLSNETPIEQKGSNLLKEAQLPRRESDYYDTQEVVNNPLKNVLPTDYGKKQEYSNATRSDSSMSQFVEGKIFQTSDQWILIKILNHFIQQQIHLFQMIKHHLQTGYMVLKIFVKRVLYMLIVLELRNKH